MNWMKTLTAMTLALAGTAVAGMSDEAVREQGRILTRAFYDGEMGRVWERFDDNMKQAAGDREKLAAFHRQIRSQLGAEAERLAEKIFRHQNYRVYRRTVRYENAGRTPFWVQWTFDREGRVSEFFIRQAQEVAETGNDDYRTRADLRLPFQGEWYVFWGGRDIEQNYHARNPQQRYAYDFVMRREGSTHEGDGAMNESYHCWGEPILAPAAGTVVTAVDEWADNRPGEMDPEHPPGNHVVIDHGNDEYSLLAHLQAGSVVVSAGDSVTAGDRVGLCGNSGNSSEPHLHFHLQTAPEFGEGRGLPAQFQDYRADGEAVARGEPVQGQVIAPAG